MADKKISELDAVLQINNDAVFPMSQDNAGEPTTFKTSITQIGSEITEDMTFSNLQTTSKKVVGAINEVKSEVSNLPKPMVMKGTLGTGGTVTALPVDGTADIGDTYRVIEAGTYASQVSDVGDMFTCITKTSSANTWLYIPSGDDFIEVTGTLLAGNTSLTISDSSISTGSTIQIFIDNNFPNCYWETVTLATGSVTITFNAQSTDVAVKVRVS